MPILNPVYIRDVPRLMDRITYRHTAWKLCILINYSIIWKYLNFCETGYAMGLIATAKVVIRANMYWPASSYTAWEPGMGYSY